MEKRSAGEEVAGGGLVEQADHVTMNSSSCFTTAATHQRPVSTEQSRIHRPIGSSSNEPAEDESTKQGVVLWTRMTGKLGCVGKRKEVTLVHGIVLPLDITPLIRTKDIMNVAT